jgi:hypothetical protein
MKFAAITLESDKFNLATAQIDADSDVILG